MHRADLIKPMTSNTLQVQVALLGCSVSDFDKYDANTNQIQGKFFTSQNTPYPSKSEETALCKEHLCTGRNKSAPLHAFCMPSWILTHTWSNQNHGGNATRRMTAIASVI